jgi:hypothetical protein
MAANDRPRRAETGSPTLSQADVFSIEFISGIFIVIGLGAFAWLFISINRDPRIINATQSELGAGATILAFLDSFGIIIPLMAILLGAFIFRLGLRLRRWNAEAAQWAQTILLWLSIGVVVVIFQSIAAGMGTDENGSFLRGVSWALPWIIILALFVFALYWLHNNMDEFGGEQALSASSTRTAWNLLIPTVAILIVVAARPLEQTFIASLTNAEFGTAQTEEDVQFVGLATTRSFSVCAWMCCPAKPMTPAHVWSKPMTMAQRKLNINPCAIRLATIYIAVKATVKYRRSTCSAHNTPSAPVTATSWNPSATRWYSRSSQ